MLNISENKEHGGDLRATLLNTGLDSEPCYQGMQLARFLPTL